MIKRNCKCPSCSPTGGAIFESASVETDMGSIPVWICRNCGERLLRRVLKTAKRARIEDTINRLIEGRF